MRKSGILLPISSLSNKYGIGTFGKEAYEFIDFLEKGNQRYWQILPLGPTSYGDSPYQSFCTFAGNPYFIDFDLLAEDGLLKESDYAHLATDETKIDYAKMYNTKYEVLRVAYNNFDLNSASYHIFLEKNSEWIDNYAVFMTLKKLHNDMDWSTWGKEYHYSLNLIEAIKNKYSNEVEYWKFIQYVFDKQWQTLKEYANKKNVEIIGDAPIYVAYDSSDVWSMPDQFQLDENLKPSRVAGCPPDNFAKTGQLWGNPLYNYQKMKETGYDWWIKRLKKARELYDVIRIDHFRGFEAYYSIPGDAKTAIDGVWVKGPGIELFDAIKKALGEVSIIAEDLGFITQGVKDLIKQTKFPGMKVLQFAFYEKGTSDYLPQNYEHANSILYTGTHDNLPTLGWIDTLSEDVLAYFDEYLDIKTPKERVEKLIRLGFMSVANTVIIPIQDYLELGQEARINTPSISSNNWIWRLENNIDYDGLAKRIAHLSRIYHRNI